MKSYKVLVICALLDVLDTVTLIPLKSVSVCNTSLSAYFTVARPPWALFDMSPQEPNISPL